VNSRTADRILLDVFNRALARLHKARGNRRAARWAGDNAAELLDAGPRTRARVRRLVAEALETGRSRTWLAEQLGGLGFDERRAWNTATTEMTAAVQTARLDTWQRAQDRGRLSDQATKVWDTVGPNPCVVCQQLHGQEQFLGIEFDSQIGPVPGPPAHPSCVCRVHLGRR
jgi:hypothetical protein